MIQDTSLPIHGEDVDGSFELRSQLVSRVSSFFKLTAPNSTSSMTDGSQRLTYGLLDLKIQAQGDTQIDDHHLVEDIGIALGQAFRQAMGTCRGITRFGHAYAPLDEALTRVVVDISGRPHLNFGMVFMPHQAKFDLPLVREFFQGFVNHAQVTLHIDGIAGSVAHHQAESLFKALGLAMRSAIAIDPAVADRVPSSKGVL